MKTPDQEKYFAEMLQKRKYRKKVKSILIPKEKLMPVSDAATKTDYMRNCVFWIEEYMEGRMDIDSLRSALNSLQGHINDLRKQYLKT